MTKIGTDDECVRLSDDECGEVLGGIGVIITPFNFPGKGTYYDGVEMLLDYKNSTEGLWDTVTNKVIA